MKVFGSSGEILDSPVRPFLRILDSPGETFLIRETIIPRGLEDAAGQVLVKFITDWLMVVTHLHATNPDPLCLFEIIIFTKGQTNDERNILKQSETKTMNQKTERVHCNTAGKRHVGQTCPVK